MTTKELSKVEFDPYYARYIYKLSDDTHLHDGFRVGLGRVVQFFESIAEEKHLHRYASGKWTVKEVLQHLVDTERIFMYRCFRIARRDTLSLAGFNQEIYIEPSLANNKSMARLLEEFVSGRQHSINLLNSLTDEDLAFIGDANAGPMSARAAAFTVIGHDIWHMEVIKQKYL